WQVFLDSPMAIQATDLYRRHRDLFDQEAAAMLARGEDPLNLPNLQLTPRPEDSMAINRIRSGAIIIAGSGMCEGGRIRHHFKHNLWRSECSIIFTGFQVRGTLGRLVVDGIRTVRVLGEELAVRARVHTIGGFSAHADQKELLEWLGSYRNKPEVFVVHGEEEVALEFGQVVQKRLGLSASVPRKGD